jgi:hypothetical protein
MQQYGVSVALVVVVWLGAVYPLGTLIQNLTHVKGQTWPIYTFVIIILFNSVILASVWYFRVRNCGVVPGNPANYSKLSAFRAHVRAAMDDWTWDAYQVCLSLAMSLSYICYTYSGDGCCPKVVFRLVVGDLVVFKLLYPCCVPAVSAFEFLDTYWNPPINVVIYVPDHGPYGEHGGRGTNFTQAEFSLAIFLFFHVLLRISVAENINKCLFSYYYLIDLCAYVAIAYYFVFVNDIKVPVWLFCVPHCDRELPLHFHRSTR